ncbi:hypothetical protein SASPL_108596 [Salvia splendens]|uniref:GH16 domain-containing protein n=1 Tax=Salvia splendens TaxID=180675 RepID=A0A8X9A7L4_SALSN|nr:hypothetical protein SASPL_108596 [Salvia splendens]
MASPFLPLALIISLISTLANAAQRPPSPGYYPSSRYRTMAFYQGSGFKSVKPFRSGYFGASIKLQRGYTAGVITAFYLSNSEAHPGFHDEVDIEFLGTTFGKPYTLQTNVYVRGSGDGRIVGREMKFRLWFDPTQDFHHYAILWTPKEITFFVDDVPIRSYPRKSATTFPLRPMWVYGSIWDASSWATENGKYKVDYRYQPFVGRFTNFKATGCTAYSPPRCRPVSGSPYRSGRLTGQQARAMQWVQTSHNKFLGAMEKSRASTAAVLSVHNIHLFSSTKPGEEPIHPRRAVDVDGPGGLFLEPVVPLGRAHVDVGSEVVELELDVLDGADAEAGHHEEHAFGPIGQAGDKEREPCEVLVADEESGDWIEFELSVVKFGGEVGEEAGGDGEHREVLEIGVVIEVVAGDVARVVRPLPPRNADAGEAVTGDLHPDQSEEASGENVCEETVAAEDAVEAGGEEHRDEAEAVDHAVAFLLEHSGSGELRREVAIVARKLINYLEQLVTD